MLNILKVAGFFQQVPSFNSLPEKTTPQEQTEPTHSYVMPDLFSGRSSKNSGSRKDVEKGASGQENKGRGKKGNNNQDDNDDNNGGGGMLEPILEDLEGFIKGRRAPLPTY